MSLSRHPGTWIESQASSEPTAARNRGFTLLEIQIAIVILALAMVGMIGHGRAYQQILTALRDDHRLDGTALVSEGRAVVSVAQIGNETSPPRCEVELESIEADGGTVVAEVRTTRRTP